MTSDMRLDRLLSRRRRALGTHLPVALGGEGVAIHQARVATRRLRELLPLIEAARAGARLPKAVRAVRRLTRLLGPVRELDVARDALAARVAALALGSGVTALVESLERRRARALAQLVKDFADRAPKLLTRLAELEATVRAEASSEGWSVELRRRVEQRVRTFRRAVESVGPLYAPQRLHELRIATKKLRYVLELAVELQVWSGGRSVNVLKASQETLGTLHDLDVLAHLVGSHRRLDSRVRDELIHGLDLECRLLHAQFLQQRLKLIVVADAVEDALSTSQFGGRATHRRPTRRQSTTTGRRGRQPVGRSPKR